MTQLLAIVIGGLTGAALFLAVVALVGLPEIGRASCRDRVSPYV